MENHDIADIKRTGAALALIGGPLTLAIGFGIHPPEKTTGEGVLQTIADNTVRWDLAHILILIGAALMIPAAIAVMHRLAGARPGFGLAGAALVCFGAVFLGALIGAEALATSAFAVLPAEERAGLAPGVQAMLDGKGAFPVVYLGLVTVGGLVLLGIGLFLARVAPRWTGIVTVAGGLLLGFPNVKVQALAGLLLTASFGYLGFELLRATKRQKLTHTSMSVGGEQAAHA